jgi:hypothetical protein
MLRRQHLHRWTGHSCGQQGEPAPQHRRYRTGFCSVAPIGRRQRSLWPARCDRDVSLQDGDVSGTVRARGPKLAIVVLLLGVQVSSRPLGEGAGTGGVLPYRFHATLSAIRVGGDIADSGLLRCRVSAGVSDSVRRACGDGATRLVYSRGDHDHRTDSISSFEDVIRMAGASSHNLDGSNGLDRNGSPFLTCENCDGVGRQ